MIVVTGAAGFIGSNLARRLAGEGHALLLVDHPLVEAKRPNLAGLDRFPLLRHDEFLDLLRRSGAPEPADGIEAVFHLGACSRTTEQDWSYLLDNNVRYSQVLWEWCAARRRPLIYASSAATYGDGTRGFDDRTAPGELRPLNLYGRSKNDFDAWALEQVAAGRPAPPRWAGMKFFNVYGHGEAHKAGMTSVVLNAWRQVVATGRVKLFRSTHPDFPDGGQRRDFVHVGDCIAHMLWLWRRAGTAGLFNSGTGRARTFLDLAHAVFAALGRRPEIEFIDMPAGLAAQYQNHTQAETGKLRAAGCDVPVTSLEDGVAEYVARLQAAAR